MVTITDVRCGVLFQRRKLFSDSTDTARQYREP